MTSQESAYNVALKTAMLQTPDPKTGRPMTQKVAGRRTGIHQTKLSRILSGEVEPSATDRRRLAKLLQRPEAELFPADLA